MRFTCLETPTAQQKALDHFDSTIHNQRLLCYRSFLHALINDK